MRHLAAAALALALLAAPAGAAGPAPDGSEALVGIVAEAAPDRVAALTEAVAAREGALAARRAEVLRAVEHERDLILELQIRRDEITRLAAVLQGASRRGAPAPRLHPQGPLAAARAETMLARLAPALRAEAAAIAARLATITAVRADRDRGIAALATELDDLETARAALVAALDERGAPRGVVMSARDAALLHDSDTLTALAASLAGPRTPDAETPALRWPVTGALLRGFREADAAGVRHPGLVLLAPPLSLVTAPAAAEVRYAGPFLDYGYVVVLEPAPGILVVLAGLARLEVAAGDRVAAGTLLGLLGGKPPDVQEYLMRPAGGIDAIPGQTLYIEVSQGQGPIDPAPLFAGTDG